MRRLLKLQLPALAVQAVDLVSHQVADPEPLFQMVTASLLLTRTLVIVVEVEDEHQLVPLRTVVGHIFYTHSHSDMRAHTLSAAHFQLVYYFLNYSREIAEASTGSHGGRRLGQPPGCRPRVAVPTKHSADKDTGRPGGGRGWMSASTGKS